MAAESMNAVAARFASQSVGSIFLYTNEAHPAEHYPHLTSMDLKYKHAHALRDVYGVTRPILLDSLAGDCHQTYGGMPNMTWIFSRNGTIFYKSDWTSAESVASALDYFFEMQDRRKNRERLSPFRVERLEYREVDRDAFYDGLARNGQRAVDEFKTAF